MAPLSLSHYLLTSGIVFLNILISRHVIRDREAEILKPRNDQHGLVFDFIVVGAGTSGSVVANRLARNYSVLLLEAGGDPFRLMKVPIMVSTFLPNPQFDWGYRSEPQTKSCLSQRNQQSLWLHGKALGGTSNLNYMAYIRGHHLDYDNWAKVTGDERWNYKNFLKYFKRVEQYHVTTKGSVSEKYFGTHGEVPVNHSPFRSIAKYFLGAAQELGYKVIPDINLPYDEAFGNYSFVIKDGKRFSTFSSFLYDLQQRLPKLTIYKYSTATRILLNKSNMAEAVEFEFNGKLHTVRASKEIIVSAGTVGSPKLLMLSGIGPKKHLESLNIPVKVNLPVGENMQDHISAFVGPFIVKHKQTFVADRDLKFQDVVDLIQNGIGPLTPSGIEATALIRSKLSKTMNNTNSQHPSKIWPDNQLILAVFPLPQDGPNFISRVFNLRPEISEEYYRPVSGTDSFHIFSVASRPKSRGYIKLASSDYRVPPVIEPRYLHDPQDTEVILDGVQTILKLVETTNTFKQIGATLSSTVFPSCKHLVFRSDAYWKCYLEHYTVTVYHPTGTCAMGRNTSKTAVLDSSLRVLGVPNLRVIDASIMPEIVSTNPQAVCIAIGEIGAEFVKQTWKSKPNRAKSAKLHRFT